MASPGVKVTEVDQSQYTPLSSPPSNAFGIVGTGKFGPVNTPTLISSTREFERTFGVSNDQSSLATINILNAGGTLYYVRAAESATEREVTITGTGGNIVFTGKYPGTITDGTMNAVVERSGTEYTITITNTVGQNTTEFVPEFTLSLNPESENYYKNISIDYFNISADGETDPTALTADSYEFSAGSDGITSEIDGMATAVTTAADLFSDPESVQIIILAAPYYSQISSVASALVSIARERKDCVAQIDHAVDAELDDITAIAKSFDSSYAAMWAGTCVITDPYTGVEESCVPSCAILPGLARMYNTYQLWNAPAGASRLQLSNIIRLTHEWTLAERDELYTNRVNPISNYKGLGYTAMGQKTLQVAPSATDRLNVRMLCNYMKVQIEYQSVGFLFSPIDEVTFNDWVYKIGTFCANIQTQRGLYDYQVKMDWETVTQDDLENNRMPGIVQIKPTKVAEFIPIDLIIKNYSDTF